MARWYHGVFFYLAGVVLGVTVFQLLPLLRLEAPRLDLGLYPVALWLAVVGPGGLLFVLLAASLAVILGRRGSRLATLAPTVIGAVVGPLYFVLLASWLLSP